MNLWERISEMFRGYTRSYRRKYESAYAKRGLLYFGAVDWLIGKAQWADDGETERGSILTSLSALSQEWKLSKKQAYTIINNLQKDDFITIEKTGKKGRGNVGESLKIIINNYDVYQSEYKQGNVLGNVLGNNLDDIQTSNNKQVIDIKKEQGNVLGNVLRNDFEGARVKEDFKEINNNNKENIINTLSSLNNIYNINNKQNYPTDISEVKKEAEKICYAISDKTAQAFIDHYSALGWRLQSGGVIVDWTKLLPRWKTSEGEKRNEKNKSNTRFDNRTLENRETAYGESDKF